MVTKRDLAAVNDEINILLPADQIVAVGVQFPTGGTGTLTLEGTIDEVTWTAIQLVTSADRAVSVTTVAAAGLWFTEPLIIKRVRLRKTLTDGACIASLAIAKL